MVLFFVIIGWVALFLTHEKSSFIWNHIPVFAYLQFPWRFLLITTFMFSVVAGSLATLFFKNRQKIVLSLVILTASILLYSAYFAPRLWLNITDADKFSGDSWTLQQTISIFDYLPIYAKHPPAGRAPAKPVFVKGHGKILEGTQGSDYQDWNVSVSGKSATIQLSLYYFPGWKVQVDREYSKIDYNNELGLITVEIPTGNHSIDAKLTNTPVRSVSNALTILGLILIPFGIYLVCKKSKNL